jgi:hypothetical protein
MENIGNIKIKKYHISFWNCEIDIDKYHIKILSLIPVKPVYYRHIKKSWFDILQYKIQPVSFRDNIYPILSILNSYKKYHEFFFAQCPKPIHIANVESV